MTPHFNAGRKLPPRAEGYQIERRERQEKKLFAALKDGPKSVKQLEAIMTLSRSGVGIHLRRHRAEGNRSIRICDYLPGAGMGRWTPVFALGTYPDAAEPCKRTGAQRHIATKKNPELRDLKLSKRRARANIKRAIAKPQGIFAALGL